MGGALRTVDDVEVAAVLALAETECYLSDHAHLATAQSCRSSRSRAEATFTCLRLNEGRVRAVVLALTRVEISPEDQAAIDRRVREFGGTP